MPRKKSIKAEATPVVAEAPVRHSRYSSTPAFVGSLVVTGILVLGGAFLVGRSDQGAIDVTATIQNANQVNIDAGGNAENNVPTTPDALRDLPNGGLVPQNEQANDQATEPATNAEESTTTETEVTESTPEQESVAEGGAVEEPPKESSESSEGI